MADTDDLLPEPPMAFIEALIDSDPNTAPISSELVEQQRGVELSDRQFEALATREAALLNEEALLDAFYEKKKAEIDSRRKRDAWYWPAFERMARAFVGDRKPRQRDITSGSVPLFVKLRKSPDALVDEAGEDSFKRFLKWNSENGSRFTRRKVWLSDLTQPEYEGLLAVMSADLLAKLGSGIEVEKNDLKKHTKLAMEKARKEALLAGKTNDEVAAAEKAAIPPGYKWVVGPDAVTIDVGIEKKAKAALPAGGEKED